MDFLCIKDELLKLIKDTILSEIRDDFKDFKNQVSYQLEGFKLAIQSINERMSSIEGRMLILENRVSNLEKKYR
jgi:uncharacterized protein YdhG (YjbR/CyaY superfamily)